MGNQEACVTTSQCRPKLNRETQSCLHLSGEGEECRYAGAPLSRVVMQLDVWLLDRLASSPLLL